MAHTRISYVKILIGFLLWSVTGTLEAQNKSALGYIDSLTAIITMPGQDEETRRIASDDLRIRIMKQLKDESLSREDNNRLWNALREMETKQGAFAILRPGADTRASLEVQQLQQELAAAQDSIRRIQQRLIRIVKDKGMNDADKALATQTLARIHSPEVLDYLFEHEPELQFGKFGSEQKEEDENYRTALKAIRQEYGESRNWMVFPYLFGNLKRLSYSEMGFIQQWLTYPTEFKSPWLLLEFMEANASPESKPVIKYMLSSFPRFRRPKE